MEEGEEEVEEVRQPSRVPSKGKRSATTKTNHFMPYVAKGTKRPIKGVFLKGKGKQKGNEI
jgi:hypothetical protein